jgi:hypothetical protein
MVNTNKLVIEVGINEGRMRDDNLNVPFTPEEIAADARRGARDSGHSFSQEGQAVRPSSSGKDT